MSDPRIVPADAERAADWIRMREALYGPGPHADELEQVLASTAHDAYLLLDARERAIGLLELSLRNLAIDRIAGPVGYVEGIYLDPVARGRGYGELLMTCAETWSRDRGAVAIATDSELDKDRAHGFYERLGFRDVGRAVHFSKPL